MHGDDERAGLRVAVAGVGRFGALHARVWQECGARVVGMCDPDGARLAQVAARRSVPHTAPSLDRLLDELAAGGADSGVDGGVDAVVIASDEHSHAALATTALAAGAHVFVEKPLALTAADAWAIRGAAATAGRHVVAGQLSRFAAPYARLRERVGAGAIGTLCTMRLRRDFSRAWFASFGDRVHPVWESCIHDLDLAVHFAGSPVTRVHATSSRAAGDAAPSVVSALLEMRNGVTATVESAWLVPDTAPATMSGALELEGAIVGEVELLGLAGILRQRLVNDALVEWTADGSRAPDLSLWPEEDGRVGGALRREVEYALAVFSGEREPDVVPIDEVCWGVAAAEATVTALRTGQPVEVAAGP